MQETNEMMIAKLNDRVKFNKMEMDQVTEKQEGSSYVVESFSPQKYQNILSFTKRISGSKAVLGAFARLILGGPLKEEELSQISICALT